MAERLGDRKVANIESTKARAVFTGNVGCLMQITRHLKAAGHKVWAAHPVDALWAGYPANAANSRVAQFGGGARDPTEWQQLAERWLPAAKALLDARQWSAAYYLAGYAVECGLKACVLARVATTPEVIFGDREFSKKCFTHNVAELVKLADLEAARVAEATTNPAFGLNWYVVKDWNEQARYNTASHQKAKKLYNAITDKANGGDAVDQNRW